MGHHLTEDGDFKSDKYIWCPLGFFALKFSDPKARQSIRRYAQLTGDTELEEDLLAACNKEERVTMPQQISRGRIVLYHVKPEDPDEMQKESLHLPAIVVSVHEDETVNLVVFVDNVAASVWLKGIKQGNSYGEWNWPPRVSEGY